MSEYRLAHAALTCAAVYILIKAMMVAFLNQLGFLHHQTVFVFTPLGVDAVSHMVWLALAGGALILREPICRLAFGRRASPRAVSMEGCYALGTALLGALLLITFLPHLVMVLALDWIRVDTIVPFPPERWQVGLLDGGVCGFAVALLVYPAPFTWLATRGCRAEASA